MPLMIVNDFASSQYLPDQLPVYQVAEQVSNSPSYGAKSLILPIDNSYRHQPACYIACYHANQGVYQVSNNNYLVGEIRIKGSYNIRSHLCEPLAMKNKDISHEVDLIHSCQQVYPQCQTGQCWVGGDTYGWYQN